MKTENNIIWDVFIRFFHWSLVIMLFIQYYNSNLNDFHADFGYLMFFLILARIVWGFIGSPNSKFKNFPLQFKELFLYFKGVATFNPKKYIGHNPAGAWIGIVFLITIILIIFTGIITLSTVEFEGMWTQNFLFIDDEWSYRIKQFHHLLTDILIFLIIFHILGVITAIIQHKKNIIKPMIFGKE